MKRGRGVGVDRDLDEPWQSWNLFYEYMAWNFCAGVGTFVVELAMT